MLIFQYFIEYKYKTEQIISKVMLCRKLCYYSTLALFSYLKLLFALEESVGTDLDEQYLFPKLLFWKA